MHHETFSFMMSYLAMSLGYEGLKGLIIHIERGRMGKIIEGTYFSLERWLVTYQLFITAKCLSN